LHCELYAITKTLRKKTPSRGGSVKSAVAFATTERQNMSLSNETLTDKIQTIIEQNSKEHQAIMSTQNNLNARVKSIELWQAAVIGGLAVLSCIIGGGILTFFLSALIP
jgi:pyruvate dehydrogenase complex dehydrogenase (E1) component